MKKASLIFALLLSIGCALFAFAGCTHPPQGSGGKTDTEQSVDPVLPGDADILVAYFSCTGNTRAVAEKIAAANAGELFEIVPAVPYTDEDLDYGDDDCRANREQNDPDARPEITAAVEHMQTFDVVFLGYPIWWGRLPKIVYTFLDTYDLSGKTIVPFCTSGGSGISASVSEIRDQEPDATVLEGRRFSASVSQAEIGDWLETLKIGSEENTQMKIVITDGNYELLYELNGSTAARELFAQLPLAVEVEPFSDNEMTFYPPEKLNTADAPLSGGEIGSLSYYAPWGDVVMFYAPGTLSGSLYEIGKIVSGTENISKLTGTLTVSAAE